MSAATTDLGISQDRAQLALRCAWEMQNLAELIGQALNQSELPSHLLALRGIAPRLGSLSCSVMSALDPNEDVEIAEKAFFGPARMRPKQAA